MLLQAQCRNPLEDSWETSILVKKWALTVIVQCRGPVHLGLPDRVSAESCRRQASCWVGMFYPPRLDLARAVFRRMQNGRMSILSRPVRVKIEDLSGNS